MKNHVSVKPLHFLFEKTGASDYAFNHNIVKRGVVYLKNGLANRKLYQWSEGNGKKIKRGLVTIAVIVGMTWLRVHYGEYVNSIQETLETLAEAIQYGELPWDEAIVLFCQEVVFTDG